MNDYILPVPGELVFTSRSFEYGTRLSVFASLRGENSRKDLWCRGIDIPLSRKHPDRNIKSVAIVKARLTREFWRYLGAA